MENKGSLTALMSSFARAYHTENDDPVVFCDALSRELMTPEEYRQMQEYLLSGIDFFAPDKKGTFSSREEMLQWIVQTQIAPTPLARARFCEDALETALRTGTRQVVILGAGMDTVAFRRPAMLERVRVFEVDHPLTQADKQRRVARAGWEAPKNLCFVPMDFAKEELGETLLAHGFRREDKTFFSWLGVSYYLTKDEIGRMVRGLAALSTEGSSLLFDCADSGLFSSPVKRVQNMIAMAAAGGEPMKTAMDYPEWERLLETDRFFIYEHLDAQEIQRRYFSHRTDFLTAFEHIQFLLAVLK